MSTSVHPGWDRLLTWLKGKGASISSESVPIEARASPGAGYGLIARQDLQDSAKLLRIPANALMNILTLGPLYPPSARNLSAVQLISLHLYLHSALDAEELPLENPFGPYISVLPRDFSFHPLTWLCSSDDSGDVVGLLKNLPPNVLVKLSKQRDRLYSDWAAVQKYLRKNPSIMRNMPVSQALESPTMSIDKNFIWAWLVVNTRCIYHRLNYRQSHPDNLTLSPIVDFANHAVATHSLKVDFSKQMGGDLILSLPSGYTAKAGDELHLTYGRHPNSTLFTEYGFVDHAPEVNQAGEAELDALLVRQFQARGSVGSYLKDILQGNNYWGDWTVHLLPTPAHPSYRLITALRLYHCLDESAEDLPPDIDAKLDIWKDVVRGNREIIDQNNETAWRDNLNRLCQELVRQARLRVASLSQLKVGNGMKKLVSNLQTLCEEEISVGLGVCQSLEDDVEF